MPWAAKMLKRTIEISQTAAYVCLRNRQLQFELEDGSQSQVACEDTGFLIVDHPRVKYSHSALVAIAEHGGVTVLCGAGHLPDAVILPVSGAQSDCRKTTPAMANVTASAKANLAKNRSR
jgi:hypothetical protein